MTRSELRELCAEARRFGRAYHRNQRVTYSNGTYILNNTHRVTNVSDVAVFLTPGAFGKRLNRLTRKETRRLRKHNKK